MKIVVSGDLGELGPKDSDPIIYYWSPLNNIVGYLPWLLIVAATVLLKCNRKLNVLWLLPVIIVPYFSFMLLLYAMDAGDASRLFELIAVCLISGTSICLLLTEMITKSNRFITLLLSIVLFAVSGAAGIIPFEYDEQWQIALIYVFIASIIIFALLLTRAMLRKRYRPVAFGLLSFFNSIITSVILGGVLAVILAMIQDDFDYIWSTIMQAAIMGFIGSYIVLLPFEILLLTNKFWNARFRRIFYNRLTIKELLSEENDDEAKPTAADVNPEGMDSLSE